MVKRSCLTCRARPVCSSWSLIRRGVGQVTTEHGDYNKHKELMDQVAGLVAKSCHIFYHGAEVS